MRKRGGVFVYGCCLIFLVGAVVISAEELSPNFRLDFLEIGFSDGKHYHVIPLNTPGPSYYVKMKARGQGLLKGKWILDRKVIGFFEVLLRRNRIVHLRGSRVPRLPVTALGTHKLTIAFTNYSFPGSIPFIRYFVVEGKGILILNPGPGTTIPVSKTGQGSLQLQWKWDYADKQKAGYQVLISKVPLRFLSEDQMEPMWKEVGSQNHYNLDLSTLRGKRKRWIYWQVRALNPSGDLLTISEISSFKLVPVSKKRRK
jgi:hypothetical protein